MLSDQFDLSYTDVDVDNGEHFSKLLYFMTNVSNLFNNKYHKFNVLLLADVYAVTFNQF